MEEVAAAAGAAGAAVAGACAGQRDGPEGRVCRGRPRPAGRRPRSRAPQGRSARLGGGFFPQAWSPKVAA
ncbi:UNVERIFIED_CONTAM: hypothetical protein ACS92_05835 [Bacillus cereus]